MKLFRQLLVAPAALGLLAPIAANAAELNINDVSDYSSSGAEVKGISQFSDIYPTDWTYQALSAMAERHGCTQAINSGAMTRYEAAAVLNKCLGNVVKANAEEQKLIREFAPELAVIQGRLDNLEANASDFEAGSFSTTTKLAGEHIFVVGGLEAGSGEHDKESLHFVYRTRLDLNTSFNGDDLLKTSIRSGNFDNSTFNSDATLESAYASNNALNVTKLLYQFPVGDYATATVGPIVRQDDMLGVWPSSYPADTVLDVLTYAGANAAYHLPTGAGAGITYAKENISASLVYVGEESSDSSQGILTDAGSDNITAQLAWVDDGVTIAAVYTHSDGGKSSDHTVGDDLSDVFDAYGISAQWDLDTDSAWLPNSLNAGFGWKELDTEDKPNNKMDESTWSFGLHWDDVAIEGNTLGFGIGTAGGWRDDKENNDPVAYEVFYSMSVSDNITVTPAIFHVDKDGSKDLFGGLVKTTFSF